MKRACVIGWPIEHSRSPQIHGYWLDSYAVEGSYTKQAVAPEALERFIGQLATCGYSGCNVTVPHKEAVYRMATEHEASARAIGSANTLWLEDGKLHAANTDTYGYMTYLAARVPGWRKRDAPVAVLGAGGAARAVIFGFLEQGVEEIRVFNRTRDRAEAIAAEFGPRIKVMDWSLRSTASRDMAVLVNTTTVGLAGNGSLDIDFTGFHPDCVVSDIVYVPLDTELIRAARSHGLATVDGLGMLLHQAVPGFEKWFGIRPEVTQELYDLVASGIGKA